MVPDAFDNPEYFRFAVKGTLAPLICYVLFVGFDYPRIYTSMITCYVVSLSTIGAGNQKGILRFGGAAVGGVMGLVALVYLLPNVDTIGGFWMVFGAGTALAAWVNFGSPRIAYGGTRLAWPSTNPPLDGAGCAPRRSGPRGGAHQTGRAASGRQSTDVAAPGSVLGGAPVWSFLGTAHFSGPTGRPENRGTLRR